MTTSFFFRSVTIFARIVVYIVTTSFFVVPSQYFFSGNPVWTFELFDFVFRFRHFVIALGLPGTTIGGVGEPFPAYVVVLVLVVLVVLL